MSHSRFAAVLAALVVCMARVAAGDPVPARPTEWLVLGPSALPAPLFAGAADAKRVDPVPEVDPRKWWPSLGGGALRAERAFDLPADSGRTFAFGALYLDADRYGAVKLVVEGPGQLRLWVDGDEAGASTATPARIEATKKLARGLHRVLVRCERNGEAGAVGIDATPAANGQQLEFGTDPRHVPAAYDEFRGVESVTGLQMSPDGKLLAVQRSARATTGDGSEKWLDVLDLETKAVRAAALCGGGATAVAWLDDGSGLLVRHGTTLKLWRSADGTLRDLVKDEPGLGAVAADASGRRLVFASTRGIADEKAGGPKRRTELRERLTDWPTAPHLHRLDVDSGVRMRLTAPGDFLQDAFAFAPDGRSLHYFRNLPRAERPWFHSELRVLDVENGTDRLVTTLTMGFENRPGANPLAVAPDGKRVAFIGPPGELGSALRGAEPNAFDPDLWIVADGNARCLSREVAATVEGHLQWSQDGGKIAFLGNDGSRPSLMNLLFPTAGGPLAMSVDLGVEAVSDVAIARDFSRTAYLGSATDSLPALFVWNGGARGGAEPWLDPNATLRERLVLARPVDVSLTAADGTTQIEGWLYRPSKGGADGAGGRVPLIVYYYGGATPTLRGWNDLHQFLVANGYAVLVVNPRGCGGYGQQFADLHVAEWGEVAGADILSAVDQVLAQHADLDASKVGCYGGSYGGFMTMWLIAHSEKFAAAVSLYGISDIASYFGDGIWGWTYGDQALANTYPWNRPEWFTEHSPLYQADHIKTPLLLMHGEVDTNVPVSESEQMFTVLKLLGREVELVRFPGEDHGLRGTWTNRVLHRTMLLEWFDKHLKAQPDAWKERWGK